LRFSVAAAALLSATSRAAAGMNASSSVEAHVRRNASGEQQAHDNVGLDHGPL
jgi:hypothetical protein